MRIACFIAFVVVSGCSSMPYRPNSNLCFINAPKSHCRGFNLLRDYDENGDRLPDAVPFVKPITSLDDLNKGAWMDVDSYVELVVYLRELRDTINEAKSYMSAEDVERFQSAIYDLKRRPSAVFIEDPSDPLK